MKKMCLSILVVLSMLLAGCGKKEEAIGIIGGADGPTEVYLTSDFSWLAVAGVAIAIVAVVVAVFAFILRKRK